MTIILGYTPTVNSNGLNPKPKAQSSKAVPPAAPPAQTLHMAGRGDAIARSEHDYHSYAVRLVDPQGLPFGAPPCSPPTVGWSFSAGNHIIPVPANNQGTGGGLLGGFPYNVQGVGYAGGASSRGQDAHGGGLGNLGIRFSGGCPDSAPRVGGAESGDGGGYPSRSGSQVSAFPVEDVGAAGSFAGSGPADVAGQGQQLPFGDDDIQRLFLLEDWFDVP